MVSFSSLFGVAALAAAALAAPLHSKRAVGKVGVAYNDAAAILPFASAASWAYNWNKVPDGQIPQGVEYCPMLWGAKMFDGWTQAAEQALASGSTCLLGFNEPDHWEQANMSPAQAVDAYKQYLTPFKDRATLVTPAVTNGGGSMGLAWMREFLTQCGGQCGAQVMAIHWYGDNFDQFKQHVESAIGLANEFGISRIWITEFAPNTDAAGQIAFLHQAIPYLNSNPSVERYAYFMAREGSLLSGGALSDIGKAYLGM
ncbi:hypothetical protein VTN49DRAFT_5497 [Thermomyces lanuginosus]|uniref:uncharacterized protein n=1 Tax=Thermomyces lanuginosus TaxID=5541 RepID=UPI0037425B1B